MKVVYLDQNHWIELSRSAYRGGQPESHALLLSLFAAKAAGRACFPISLAHYLETHKQRDPFRRWRLAKFMMKLSDGMTIAPPHIILNHEIQNSLARRFPGRVQITPLQLLGSGFSHAADAEHFILPREWPKEASALPPATKHAFEMYAQRMAELSLLSSILPGGFPSDVGPLTDLSAERRFKGGLEKWRGAAGSLTTTDLDALIRTITLDDIKESLSAALDQNQISVEEFVRDPRWPLIVEELASRRADMHLRREWAKNGKLTPKDSDLNDWAFLGVAATYCDVLVTEKQTADLFSRKFPARAKVTARLSDLPGPDQLKSSFRR